MINFNKILRESREQKFEALDEKRETEPNPYSCNYCPKSHHKYCEHKHCILDPEWIKKENEKALLQQQLKEEMDYLKNGEGTVGYDRLSVYKNVLKLKKQLRELLGERRK